MANMQNDQLADKLSQVVTEAIKQQVSQRPNNYVTLQSVHVSIVNHVMKQLGLTWTELAELVEHYVPIHEQIREILLKFNESENEEETFANLSQAFVKIDKLSRFKFTKNRTLEMQYLCAVDGITVRHGGPGLDWKRYATNLRYPLRGSERCVFDDDPNSDLKRLHVQTIRAMYDTLDDKKRDPARIYQVMQSLVKDAGKKELSNSSKQVLMTQDELNDLKAFYKTRVDDKSFERLLKLLKIISEEKKTTTSSDVEKRGRKRKKVERTETCKMEATPVEITNDEEEASEDDTDGGESN